MESASASNSIHLKVLFLLLIIPILIISASNVGGTIATAHTKPPRLVMKLIHRDSIFSPHYNPTATISERAWQGVNSSEARYAHLTAKTRSSSTAAASNIDVKGGAIPDHGTFLVNLSIGQPPVPQLVMMDTGSSLLWIQCLPCIECFKQSCPIFDPSKSSTYGNLQCNSSYCLFDPLPCDSLRACQYEQKYMSEATSIGILGMEELTFMTYDQGTISVPHTVFGCGAKNKGIRSGLLSGILGLGWNRVSLVYHIGSKFSYCIGKIDNPQYEYNQLIIGDGAKIEGYSTPLEVYDELYYLTLEGISVGEEALDINPEIFRRGPSGHGGVLIDSGTTITYLHKGGYEPLREKVDRLIGSLFRRVTITEHQDLLCYKGSVSEDLRGFPVVTFHFARGADLVLDVDALFGQATANTFCMFVEEAPAEPGSSSLTIIGIRAQQYYNVGYDLDAMKLYLQRIDCDLLED